MTSRKTRPELSNSNLNWCPVHFLTPVSLRSFLIAQVKVVFERYVVEMGRLWSENARKYLPHEVADHGLRIERIGKGEVACFVARPL